MAEPGRFTGAGIVHIEQSPRKWRLTTGSLLRSAADEIPVLLVRPMPVRVGYPLAWRQLRQHGRPQPVLPAGERAFEMAVPLTIPGGRVAAVRAANNVLISGYIRSAMRELGWRRGFALFSWPWHAALAGRLAPDLVSIYNCVDLYRGYKGMGRRGQELTDKWEREAMQSPGLAIAPSARVADRLRGLGDVRTVIHLPFSSQTEVPPPRPGLLPPAIRRPVLGFVGLINTRHDYHLLGMVARAYPQASVVLAGPVELTPDERRDSGFDQLAAQPNVHLLGELSREDLAAVAGVFDVGMVPYLESDMNAHAAPAKIFDYMAARVPTVATSGVDTSEFADLVRVGDGAAFVAAVGDALAEGVDRPALEAWLGRNSHEVRRAEFLDLLAQHLRA